MVFNQTEKQERSYLQQIITRLKQIISHTDMSVKNHADTLAEYKDYLWNNKDIDPHEIRSMRESILNHFAIGESVIDKRRRLAQIVDIPYFGRIDFQEKNENRPVIPVYIGIHTFHDTESRTTVIYDWRAPISSMFYDHELSNRTRNEHEADFATITLKHSTSSLFNTILITILLVAYVLVLYLHPRGYIHRSSKSSFCTDSRMLTFIAYIIT